jgi:hypothetical protein
MKISIKFFAIAIIAFAFVALQACNMSTANLSSLKTYTDKDGKAESSAFKTGDVLNGRAQVSNNPGKVKVKFTLVADDVKGMTKGEMLKGSDVTVDIENDGIATYTVPVSAGFLAGSYTLNADMVNSEGAKKDSKTAKVTVTQIAPPAAATEDHKTGDKDADKDDDKDDK